jgi:hypothetical protein
MSEKHYRKSVPYLGQRTIRYLGSKKMRLGVKVHAMLREKT